MQKRARRDRCNCQNNAVGSALERRGLGASFEGYYTFVEALNVALSEVKEHAQPYLVCWVKICSEATQKIETNKLKTNQFLAKI